MLTHEPTSFRPKLKDRQRRRIIYIKRGIIELPDATVQLSPLITLELSVTNLLASDLTRIDNKTIDELHVAHFQ